MAYVPHLCTKCITGCDRSVHGGLADHMATEQALAIPAAAMPAVADIARHALSHLRLFLWLLPIRLFNLATMNDDRHVLYVWCRVLYR